MPHYSRTSLSCLLIICASVDRAGEVEDRYVHPVMSPALQALRARRTVTSDSTVQPFRRLPGESRRTWLRKIHLSTNGMAGVSDDVGHASRDNGPVVRVTIAIYGPDPTAAAGTT